MRLPRRPSRPAPLPVDLAEPLALLGLASGACEALIEIAYRCRIEHLARADGDTSSRRERRRALDEAVATLRAALEAGRYPPPAAAPGPAGPYEVLALVPSADQALIDAAYGHALRGALAAGDEGRAAALEWAYSRIGSPEARGMHERERPRRRRAGPRRMPRAARPAAPPPPEPERRRAGPDAGRRRGLLARVLVRRPPPAGPPPPAARGTGVAVPTVARPVHTLAIELDGQVVDTVELRDGAAYIIGASAYCDIPLVPPPVAADAIAPAHARIAAGVGGVSFRHLAERAETLVNGRPARWTLLEPGDELSIGPYRCRYEIARYQADPWRVAAWS